MLLLFLLLVLLLELLLLELLLLELLLLALLFFCYCVGGFSCVFLLWRGGAWLGLVSPFFVLARTSERRASGEKVDVLP